MTVHALAQPDNQLSFTDQVMFLALRSTGEEAVAQVVWVYEHPVDSEALKRFHSGLDYGLLGRRIECSALPFGRHRWVSAVGQSPDIDIAESSRPRSELSDWADERAQLPIDPEWGPGWHLGVAPFTDGSTAVSLVWSHCLADGIGGFSAISDAVEGNAHDLGYPPPRSRTRRRSAVSDARETVRDAGETARALGAAAKLAFRRRHDVARSTASRPAAIRGEGADCNVVVPAITIYVDLDKWDARAESLNGTSHSLVAGFAAKLGECMGRRHADDGAVTLNIPISDRGQNDTRANAVVLTNIGIDPTQVTADLSGARGVLKQALKTARDVPDEALELLPLTPFIPKRVVKRSADVLFGFAADLPVSCSNLGDVDPAVGRADGTDAEYVMLRGVDRYITRQALEQRRGRLTVVAGRIVGKMSITVVAYRPGGKNTKPDLRELAAHTLAEFDLTGVID
jgi:hypothetical protein